MLKSEDLKDVLHQKDLKKIDQILACLSVEDAKPKQVKEIKSIAYSSGLRVVRKWDVSKLLSRSKGLAARTNEGWELTNQGIEHISNLFEPFLSSPSPKAAIALRNIVVKIQEKQTKAFVEEAIRCLELKQLRASVVLSWVGAISVLQEYVIKNKLSDFNTEAFRRNAKWKNAKNKDDLSNMKEFNFLDVLESISVIGKSVKQELQGCLKFRNGCGHPNSLRIGESRVAAHIESLTLNVFLNFTH